MSKTVASASIAGRGVVCGVMLIVGVCVGGFAKGNEHADSGVDVEELNKLFKKVGDADNHQVRLKYLNEIWGLTKGKKLSKEENVLIRKVVFTVLTTSLSVARSQQEFQKRTQKKKAFKVAFQAINLFVLTSQQKQTRKLAKRLKHIGSPLLLKSVNHLVGKIGREDPLCVRRLSYDDQHKMIKSVVGNIDDVQIKKRVLSAWESKLKNAMILTEQRAEMFVSGWRGLWKESDNKKIKIRILEVVRAVGLHWNVVRGFIRKAAEGASEGSEVEKKAKEMLSLYPKSARAGEE
jgi:hypothetical protein